MTPMSQNRSKMFKPMSSQLDVSELKFPALSPADLLRRRIQVTSMKRNTKINFSSVPCELVSFPMEEQQRIIHISSRVIVQTF